jgi:ferredoxin-NADP reductase
MMFWKRKIRYEIRKYTHYLFLVFGLAMCFHVPASGFPNGGFAPYVFGILLSWWALDNLYVQWFLTEKIQSSRFYVLPSGVQLTMAVSERFQSWGPGGYCYVCLPWVNPHQWHAFSLFENPIQPSERQIFMQKLGDWTTQVHTMLGRETSRPVWIQGPFTSPYGNADNYDSQILVAGGIGITPALSVIRQLKDTRRCNLIWATRDRHMLEFFIKHADLSHRGWNLVFYTGKEQLLGIEDVVVTGNGATIHIIRQRPKLNFVIPNIIYGIESGTSRPEQFVPDDKIVAMELLQEKLAELEEDPMMNSHEKLSELVNYCDELGYLFSDLISTLPNHEELTKTPLVSMENKSNRSVLDAILHFNTGDSPKNGDSNNTANDRRGVFLNQAQGLGASKRTMLNSSRSMLASASRRRLTESGSSGMRHRRSSGSSNEPILSGGGGGTKRGQSITTSTWGALAASIQAVRAMQQFEFSEGDESSSELDVESARMPTMQQQMEFPFKPWEYNQEAEDYVKNMGRQALSTWGVLYCGGKTPLEKALRKAARKAKVQMHEESFAW